MAADRHAVPIPPRCVRNPRVEASGNSGPKIRWRAIPTPAATTRSLYCGWALASRLASRRVPTQTASAPSASAAATVRPSAMPPAATTGTEGIASMTAGSNENVAAAARLWPPASLLARPAPGLRVGKRLSLRPRCRLETRCECRLPADAIATRPAHHPKRTLQPVPSP